MSAGNLGRGGLNILFGAEMSAEVLNGNFANFIVRNFVVIWVMVGETQSRPK